MATTSKRSHLSLLFILLGHPFPDLPHGAIGKETGYARRPLCVRYASFARHSLTQDILHRDSVKQKNHLSEERLGCVPVTNLP